MKIPQAIEDELRQLDAERVGRAEAVARLRDIIRQDPAYADSALVQHAGRLLTAWRRAHPSTADPKQLSLFPDLPAELHVCPGVSRNWLGFTRRDWETARNMLLARTENYANRAATVAASERAAFMRAYDAVVPLLTSPKMTTADVAAKITGAA